MEGDQAYLTILSGSVDPLSCVPGSDGLPRTNAERSQVKPLDDVSQTCPPFVGLSGVGGSKEMKNGEVIRRRPAGADGDSWSKNHKPCCKSGFHGSRSAEDVKLMQGPMISPR